MVPMTMTQRPFAWRVEMDAMQNRSFNSLVKQFLGVRLPDRLSGMISYPDLPLEAQHFTLRMLTLMQRASYAGNDFTPLLMRALSTIATSSLPCAWDGRIPPITMAGRHRKLDAYVVNQPWAQFKERPIFLDLGCGFPPATTLDTANNLPQWAVFGVDRTFAPYVLYDSDGHYACFDHNGNLLYLQTRLTASGRDLNDHPKFARSRFKALFERMYPILPVTDGIASAAVDLDDNKLIHNPIRDFEADNLAFIQTDIETLDLSPARVIRCMNVLLYFDAQKREEMLLTMGRRLDDGGILIAGFNHYLGSGARYVVYRRADTAIIPGEFAFSLDNLWPVGIAPWYTLHDDDPDAVFLADLTAAVRNDPNFWPAFSHRVDDLMASHAICRRGSDGFLLFLDPPMALEQLIGKLAALWQQIDAEGFTSKAVEALGRAGYRSWINPVGDISVEPHTDRFPPIGC